VPCANNAEFWLRLAALRVRWRAAYAACVAPGSAAGARFRALFAPGADALAACAAAGGDAAGAAAVLAHAARVACPRSTDVALAHALALEAEGGAARRGEALAALEVTAGWAAGCGEVALARAQALTRAGRAHDAAHVLEEGASAVAAATAAAAAGGEEGAAAAVAAEGALRAAARLWDARARLEASPSGAAAVWAAASGGGGGGGAPLWAAWAAETAEAAAAGGEAGARAKAAAAALAVLQQALGLSAAPQAARAPLPPPAAAQLWARYLHLLSATTSARPPGELLEAWAAHVGWRCAAAGEDPAADSAAAAAADALAAAGALKRRREEGQDGQQGAISKR
jgi:hypothetical protein